MAEKYFQKTLRPDVVNGDVSGVINTNASDKVFASGDILFDWQPLDLPKGTDAVVNGSIHMYGVDGGATARKDLFLLFAKSNNGVAPTTLGVTNLGVTGCYELPDILLGSMKFEGNTNGQGIIDVTNGSIYYYGVGSSSGTQGPIVLETSGTPGSATTQRVYVAGLAGGSLNFSTGILLNDASHIADDAQTSLPVDGVDPRLAFRVGDTVYIHDVDTPVGTVASLSANAIVLTANNVGAIANNDEFINAQPFTMNLSFRNPR